MSNATLPVHLDNTDSNRGRVNCAVMSRVCLHVCCRPPSFLSVSEGLLPGVAAGVEEVAAIATLQYFVGSDHARAKLVRLPQVRIKVVFSESFIVC